jgi:SAM-dependent methyltransferase
MAAHDMATYDPDQVRGVYEAYGEREWDRFHKSPVDQVNLHIHSHYLRKYVRAGHRVLDVGAGPGRFTIEAARLGARVTVGDLSPVQLDEHRRRVYEAGCETSVESRALMDIMDLSALPANSFDVVLCFGGPLSYVFDGADRAVDELLRVTKPGGHVLVSVMSLVGTMRWALEGLLVEADKHGLEAVKNVSSSGDLPSSMGSNGHACRMYTWARLEELLQRHACEIVDASASNNLTARGQAELGPLMARGDFWPTVLEWELQVCREKGSLDSGTHILAVLRKPG